MAARDHSSPLLRNEGGGGYSGFGLSVVPSVRSSFRPSVSHSVRHNFVSAQNLEKKLKEFHQLILYNDIDLGSDLFRTFVIELWPLIDVRISLR